MFRPAAVHCEQSKDLLTAADDAAADACHVQLIFVSL